MQVEIVYIRESEITHGNPKPNPTVLTNGLEIKVKAALTRLHNASIVAIQHSCTSIPANVIHVFTIQYQ
jgi:hypothetical protein